MKIRKVVHILPGSVSVDGTPLAVGAAGTDLLADLYRCFVKDYPKFFKMDLLSKLGVIGTELLVAGEPDRFTPREDRAVLLFSRSGSLCDDRNYQKTISEDDFFPSPSLFVYTLANIVTGEIAIRNKYEGDTTAFELPSFEPEPFVEAVRDAFEDRVTRSAVCGWAEAVDPAHFEAWLLLVDRDADGGPDFSVENVSKIILNQS